MKIVTITTIKNEADIIESFIRYHLNIVDNLDVFGFEYKFVLHPIIHNQNQINYYLKIYH